MTPLLLFLLALFTIYVGTVRAAFTAMLGMSVRFLVERQSRGDSLAGYLESPIRLFVPARLFVGLAIVTATALFVTLLGDYEPHDVALLLGSMVLFALVCEQFVPQLIVRRHPQPVLEFLLPSFDLLAKLVAPVTRVLLHSPRPVERESADDGGRAETSSEAEEPTTDATEPSDPEPSAERRLLQSVVDFGDRLVREVMTPRPDIVGIDADATVEELRRLFREQEYSRIPVYRDNLDNIQGFVFVKDLLKHDVPAGDDRPVSALARPAFFVPETKPLPELLKEFQRRQLQSAIVVDEYGGTAGLVTLEDLLEEIVGEIRDEYDVETEPVVDEGEGRFLFSGKVNIDELAERLETKIDGEGFETVGGYLLTQVGRVPSVGETFDIDGLHIEVLEAERRRVKRVRVSRAAPVMGGD
ncbi:MAG: hemolysin family protein [Vicinamibacterales bacterium]